MVIPDKDTNPDEYETDIRKNLFFDYYSDNLVNAVLNAQDVEKKRRVPQGKNILVAMALIIKIIWK